MTLRRVTAALLITAAAITAGLLTQLAPLRPEPALAQQVTLNRVTVHALQQTAREGGLAQFSVRRVEGNTQPQTVRVKTWETEHDDPVHGNLTEQTHTLTFPHGSRDVTLDVAVYNDEWPDRDGDIRAEVQASPDNGYQVGSPSLASIQVLSSYYDTTSPTVRIERENPQITEGGGQNVQFRIHRTKDTSQDTTVLLRVDDPGNRLRGNHWDPPPELPTQFVVPAGQTWAMLTIPLPDDHRDAATQDEDVTVTILPSHDYLLFSHSALTEADVPVADDVTVRDDDDAQELELNFGKDGTNDADADEGDTLKLIVKRRSTDTGNPARFTVRVTTDRSGPDPVLVLDDWEQDGSDHYREYSLELTGTDTQVEQEIPVTQNGESEDDWTYTVEILPLQDHQGQDLDSATEAMYWTVKSGFRETEVASSDSGDSSGTVTISTDVTEVQEGGEVPYTLTRVAGKRAEEVTVEVRTREPDREAGNGTNPSDQDHTVVIEPWAETATFSVYAYVDGVTEPGTDVLNAWILEVTGGDYETGSPRRARVEINDPPGTSAAVALTVDNTGINEGQTATFTFTRTGGDTAQALTVDIRVDDDHGFLRGNHWDPGPEIPTQIVFAANETSKTLALTAPDDLRDLPAGTFTVTVLPGTGYHPGNTGVSTKAGVIVVDNDIPQELTFEWGYIDGGSSFWDSGQSYWNNGPAEGTWHYTDGRSFSFDNEIETYWPAHFQVSRRNQDKDRTASFTVRVEHDRGWLSPRHSDWTLDPATGKHYKDFPLTLTGGQRSVVVRIEVLDNSQDIDWSFSARVLPLADASTGSELDAAVEAQYWTFDGQREKEIDANNAGVSLQINLQKPTPMPVPEGDQVQFPVRREAGYALEPVTVQIRTWEPNRREPGGTNPTDQVHTLTFPALTMGSTFIASRSIDQTQTITVTTEQDSEYEARDRIQAEVVSISHSIKGDDSKLEQRALIRDDDRATIALSSDTTSITEGETVTFTLTRTNNTAEELQVGVTLEDPGGFLEGNSRGDEVTVPSTIDFGAGDTTATLEITPPDDRRDIADSALTLTLESRREYEIPGADSITVSVADNDTAPQVSISFEPAEVEEGQNLVLWITRTGQDTNPIEVPVTTGPVGDQRYTVFRLGAGITRYGLSYSSVDDDYKGPDIHYQATLHPQDPKFWVPTGDRKVSGTILDNDLYTVGIERIRITWDEGKALRFRVFHDGHTGAAVPVNLLIEEAGNAVSDDLLGPRPASIPYGTSTLTPVIYTEANDGSDGDAIFTVRLQPGDGYEIDPDNDIAAMIVRDLDPLPVIRFENNRTDIPEAAGTGEVWVELVSAVPTVRDVWVNYQVRDTAAADHGEDFTETSGRLQFEPGETRKAIEIEILQDRLAEADEQFAIYLKTPQFAVLEDGQETLLGVGAIVDDEPHVSMTLPNDTVTEGTDATFNLARTESTAEELTVWVRVIKSAPFSTTTQEVVVFAAGSATAQLAVPTEDDDERLGTYTVRAGLLYPPLIGKPWTYWREGTLSHTVTVRDNDLESVRLVVDEGRVQEGDPVTFTLRRGNTESTPLEITLDIEGGAGYTTGTIPSTATIPAGASSVQTSIQTVDDSTAESNGALTVTILDGTGYRPAYPNTFTFSIFDDDGALPAVRVNRTTAWVDEGEDVVFRVIRSGSTTDALDVRLRLYRLRSRVTQAELDDPTLGVTTPVHLVPLNHEVITVNFPAGTSQVTVTRSTTDDSFNYGNSSYHAFVLADADDGYTAYYEHAAEVWVQDDDRPVVTIGNAATTTFYGYPGAYYPGVSQRNDSIIVSFNLTRTGDTSGLLPVAVRNQPTTRWPAPRQDETGVLSTPVGKNIQPGEATSTVTQTGFANVNALGRTRTLFLGEPHSCPDDPEECGYGPQYTLGTSQEATVQVRSNLMGVRIEAGQASVTEGTAATFTMERHGGKPDAMTRPLTVRVEVTQRGDFITGTTPSTMTFPANQSSLTLTVPTENDTLDEASGRVTATILIPTSLTDDEQAYETGIYPGTPWDIHSAFTRVNDDDTTSSSISVSDQEVDEDAGTVTFTVSLDQANNDNPVSFDWSTRDGTATAGQDYQANSGSHTFAVGETSQDFTVTITDDTQAEGDETFDVALSNLSQAQAADTTGTITILDDELDHGVTIESAPLGVQEGEEIAILLRRLMPTAPTGTEQASDPCFRSGGQAVMCFDPDAGAGSAALTLDLQVSQTGSMISQALPASVTFQSGSRFAVVRVQTDDDSLAESAGSLTVTILNGQGYTPEYTGAVTTRTVAIHDNDLTLSIADADATEGTDTTVDFTVSLNTAAPETLTVVASTTDGDATSHANVTPASLGRDFEAKTETVTFQAGEQTQTFSVSIEDDTFHERHETFTVTLSGQPEHAVLQDATATGTIRNDDGPMTASVTRAYATVNEDHAGAVRFTVNLDHATTTASERNPAVAWQITAGTATEGDDYLTTDGKVFIPVGSTAGFIEVDLVDDGILEPELETFSVDILEPGSRQVVISATDNSFEASVRDDETLSARITADAENAAEGEDAGFTVTLMGGTTTRAVQVNFETGGEASAGTDYNTPIGNLTFPAGDRSGQSGTLTIPAGASSGTITFPIIRDEEEDDGETLIVEILNASHGARRADMDAGDEKATTTILDQDMITVSLNGAPMVTEGTDATFTVTLSSPSAENISAGWSSRDGTAQAGQDYDGTSGTVAISAGSTSATITVPTTQDTLAEGDETFTVTLDEATSGTGTPPEMVPLGVTERTATILDDDTAPDSLTIQVTPDRTGEGDGATDLSVTVTLGGSTQLPTDTGVEIAFQNRPGRANNATLDEDYTGTTVSTVIPAGQSSVTTTITITPVEDLFHEGDANGFEFARLNAEIPSLSLSKAFDVRILDNDAEPSSITLAVTPDTVDESASVVALSVTGTLAGDSRLEEDAVVTVSLADGTATAEADYESATATLTIPAGQQSATITMNLSVLEDNGNEDDETVQVTGAITGTITVTPAEVTIQDNDTAPTGISLQAGSTPINEDGGAVTIPVTATFLGSGTQGNDTVVDLEVVALTATDPDDYTASFDNAALTIPAGQHSATANLTVTPVDDTLHEGDESIAVRGANTTPGLTVNGVRLEILDDDPAPATIKLEPSRATIPESEGTLFIEITATIEGDSTLTEDTRINTRVVRSDPSARSNARFQLSPMVILAGETSATSKLLLGQLDDQVDDDDETIEITGRASNPDLTVLPAEIVIQDDDTAGVTVSTNSLTIDEGLAKRYQVYLDTEPTADVTVNIDVPAGAPFTVSPGSLTLTARNWHYFHNVRVRTIRDLDGDDEPAAVITHSVSSDDTLYRDITPGSVTVTVRDTSQATVTLDPTALTINEGDTGTYTVELDTEPTGNVTVTIGGHAGTEVSLDKTTLTFTTSNWETSQTVTVTAGQDDDAVQDSVTLTHTVTGGGYDGITAGDVTVTVTDDDTAGVNVSESSLEIHEGNQGTYTVVLDTQPAGDVTVTVTGHSGTDLSVDVTELTFTNANWSTAQTVTVTAEHDGDSANEAQVTLAHTVASTDDSTYNGISAGSVTVDVTDDDTDGVTVNPTELTVTEGLTAEYTVVLNTLPSGTVTVTINDPTDNTDVTADPASLTFTTSNWDQAQTVTVRAAQDNDADDETATVTHEVTGYGSVTAANVDVTLEDDAPDTVTVSYEESTYTVAEGNTVNVKVLLSADPERTVTVPVSKSNQGGASSADYSGVPANVVFNSGDTQKSITFSATQDTVDDDGESVQLGFGTLPDGVTAGTNATTTVNITDDDAPAITVSFGAATYTVAESDDTDTADTAENEVAIRVKLSADPERTVTIPLTHQGQDGASSADYSGVPVSVVFNSGDTEKDFTLTATHDTVDDDGEKVKIGFGATLPDGVSAGTPNETLVSIQDDDVPSVTANFEQETYTVQEGSSVSVTVTLSADPERSLTIPITTANQGGASSADYSVPSSITIATGETSKSITFSATEDTVDDDGESVKLGFGETLPTGVSAGTTNETTVNITDDDDPAVTVRFGSATHTVAEGSSASITVNLSADPERTVTIPLTKDNQDGATDSDYSGVPTTVVFNTGETEKNFTFSATQDTDDDDGESVKLGFGETLPTGVSAGTTNETTVNITDDDHPLLKLIFAESSYTVTEGSSATITIQLNAVPEREVEIGVTATPLGDTSAADYSGAPTTVTIGAQETSGTLTLMATDDAVDDDGESVRLGFSATLPAGITPDATIHEGQTAPRNVTTVSITDNDNPAVTVRFEQDTYTAQEGGTARVKLLLSTAPEREVEITILKANQEGATADDYSGVPSSVTFSATDTEKEFTFNATEDTVDDDGESVKLTISSTLPAGVTRATPHETTISITDDDDPAVNVSYSAASYTASEGGTVTIAVQLDQAPERALTIPLTHTPQDGASAADYSGVPASLSFAAADTEKDFTFTATDDTVDDDGEKVKLGFGTLPTGVSAGTNSEATVSITDGDVPTVTVSYENASYSVDEGSAVTIKVVLSADPERTVTIPISPTNQEGASNDDYSGVPANVVFNSEDTQKTFDITATDDSTDDDGEKVRLGFGTLPASVNPGTNSTATVSLNDNDDPAVTASFGAATYTVQEGNTVTVTLNLSADPERTVTIPITHEGQDGATAQDYSGVPGTVTFDSGETSQTFNLSATEDTTDDDGESVKISLGTTLPTGVTAGTVDETVVSITDDDHPSITVSFGQASHTVTEGQTTEITVKLSADPERTVTIPLTHTPQDGAIAQDYSGVPPTGIIFLTGETEKNFDLRATNDSLDDDGESVKLGFGTLPTGISTGTHAETVVSITDNDDPAVTVSYQQTSYTVAEGSNVTVKVTLSADPERTVAIPVTKSNQGGATDSDYSGVPASITFNSGDTEREFSFSATDDSDNDDGESVKLGFGATLPAGVSAGSTNETTVNITDDDVTSVTVNFEESTYTVAEGNGVTVKVTLSADPQRTVTIPITKSNQEGASAGDYSGVPADLTFNSGDTEKEFTFTATDDSVDDDGEKVQLGFQNLPTGVTAGNNPTTTVSITDNDDPAVTVSFASATYTVQEGGSVEVTVNLSADPERTVSVSVNTTHQDGATNADYSGPPTTLTFNSGDASKSFDFGATDDNVDDDGEKVKLTFGNLSEGVTAGSPNESVVSITDDDDPPVTVSFGSATYTVAEGNSVTLSVTLSADPERTVTIPITASNQGGASNSDYSAPTSVTFNSGDTEKEATFTANADDSDDDGESVKLGFGTLPTGVSAGSTTETVVSITDQDTAGLVPSSTSFNVQEGGTTDFTIKLATQPTHNVTVTVESNDTGAATVSTSSLTFTSANWNTAQTVTVSGVQDSDGDDKIVTISLEAESDDTDYDEKSASLTATVIDDDTPGLVPDPTSLTVTEDGSGQFTVKLATQPQDGVTVTVESGDTGAATVSVASLSFTTSNWNATQSVTVSGVDDSDTGNESVTVTLTGSSTDEDYSGKTGSVTVTVTDDDTPNVVVDPTSLTVGEAGTNTFTVKLGTQPSDDVSVSITSGDTGAATVSPTPLTFTPTLTFAGKLWSSTQTVTVHGVNDSDTSNEDVTITVSGSGGGYTDKTATVSVTVTDDDDVPVSVKWEHATHSVTEGGTAVVKVQLDKDPERTVTIPVTKANQDGATDADYSGVPASITFNSGDTEKEFTFSATADTVDDDGEKVKLGFGTLPADVTAGTPSESVVSIVDNDDPDVTVSFEESTYTVAEGNSVTVKVVLDQEPERSVTIGLTKDEQDGASTSDYSGVPSSVTFAATETEKTFTFSATQDTSDDGGESVKLGFDTSLPTGVTTGSQDETTVSITDDDVPAVTASFGATTYTVAEGNDVTVTVNLSADPERTVTIPLTTDNQDGASAADYSGVPASVTFAATETEKTFTFTATQDTGDDDGESVKLGFGTLPTGVSEGTPAETTVSIDDDDAPESLRVSFGAASYSASEGGTTQVSVTLNEDPERTVTIPLDKTNLDGASDSDYSGVPTSVVFNSGDTGKEFTFTAQTDLLVDPGEKVKLTFGTLPTGVSAGTTSETTVSILEVSPQNSLSVSFGAPDHTVNEGNSVTITVSLDQAPGSAVQIPISTENQGGASAADYSGVPTNVTFGATDTSRTFTFTATQDTDDDDGESVKLTFGTLPSGVNAGTHSQSVISITDDDDPSVTVSFGQASHTVGEGNGTTIRINLSADPERTVTIPITKDNQDGASNADYSGVPASVTFNSGDTAKTFIFSVVQDTVDDDGESVKLGFGTLPTGVSAGSPSETAISFTDDDDPSVNVSFEQATYTVAEGGSVSVKVKLNKDPERQVVIPLTKTNQGGASSADYSGVPASITFNSGDTEQTFSFSATSDSVDDDGESVKLGFGTSLPTGVSTGTTDETVVSITDDDLPSVTASFEQSTYTVAEGGSITVKVKLSADPERTVTIPISKTNQGGAANADYSGVPASVVLNSGDTEKTFDFQATQDTTDDDGESVKLAFGTMPTGVTAGSPNEATVSITDDDHPSITVTFGAASYTVTEGQTASITITMSAAPERVVTIPLTHTHQDGASNPDYAGNLPTGIIFLGGDTQKSFNLTAIDDSDDDDGESVKLGFGATLPAGISTGTHAETVVDITDNDDPSVTVSFGATTYTVTEGSTVAITVNLSADPERTVSVSVNSTPQDGASAADFSGAPTTLTFNPGDTSKSFDFGATDDSTDDDGESVKLTFGNLSTGVTAGSPDETVVSITDNDETVDPQVSVQVSFQTSAHSLLEGAAREISVILSQDPERTVTIPITTSNGTGATNADYSGVPASITFNSGDTGKSFTFTATQDNLDESPEEITLGFGTLPEDVSATNPSQTVVTIFDSVQVSFEEDTYEAYEGGEAAVVAVVLDGPAATGTVIPITAQGMNGADSSDWTGAPISLTFGAGDTRKTFTITAYDDTVEDDGETVELGFGSLPSGVALGSPSAATVELMNMEDNPSLTQCPADSGQRIVLNARGEIQQAGDSVYHRLQLDPHRTYIIELLGAERTVDIMGEDSSSDNLTLDNPLLMGVWNDDRSRRLQRNPNGLRLDVVPGATPSGWHQLEVAGDGGAGTYRIKVRVNNVCTMSGGRAMYPWSGGPDGYAFDTAASISTDRVLEAPQGETWGFLGDNWDWYWEDVPDEDWFRVTSLTAGQEYEITVRADDAYPARHQATDLKIVGIYDGNGDLLEGTQGTQSGSSVTMNFTPDASGTYHIAVGSGSSDRTGMYRIAVAEAE